MWRRGGSSGRGEGEKRESVNVAVEAKTATVGKERPTVATGTSGVRYVYDDADNLSMEERRALSKKYRCAAPPIEIGATTTTTTAGSGPYSVAFAGVGAKK